MTSRRPVGAPKGNLNRMGGNSRFITQQLIMALNTRIKDPSKKTKVEDRKVRWLVEKLVDLALDGDTTCIKMVMDRVEGMATQAVVFQDTPEREQERITYTREQLQAMSPEQRNSLYLATLRETTRTHGSA